MNATLDCIETVDLGIDLHAVSKLELITLGESTHLIRGKFHAHIHLQVLQRYANPGRGKIVAGRRIVIPTLLQAGRRWTTRAAVEAWLRKCNELAQSRPTVTRETPRQRRRSHDRATERLRKRGMRV